MQERLTPGDSHAVQNADALFEEGKHRFLA